MPEDRARVALEFMAKEFDLIARVCDTLNAPDRAAAYRMSAHYCRTAFEEEGHLYGWQIEFRELMK